MVQIIHKWGRCSASSSVNRNIRFMLTNRKGGYICLPTQDSSRYDGFFIFDTSMYKIVDSLEIEGEHDPISLVQNNFSNCLRQRGELTESFFIPQGSDSFIYELNSDAWVRINLDVKESYDNREFGRYYHIDRQDELVVIKFTKKREQEGIDVQQKVDVQLNSGSDDVEYSVFVAIKFEGSCDFINEWKQVHYYDDLQRNSPPFDRFVFQAVRIKSKKIVVAAARDASSAMENARSVYEQCDSLKKQQESYYKRLFGKGLKIKSISPGDNTLDLAYKSALFSLDSLFAGSRLFAGLPWFFQFWTRDEAISCGGLIASQQFEKCKRMLFEHLGNICKDGTLPNRIPSTDTGSADSIGWCFSRISELNHMHKLEKSERIFAAEKLRYSILQLLEYKTASLFASNNSQETWMDTVAADRSGQRIEIQALRLAMYQLMHQLTKEKQYAHLENALAELVRKEFWKNGIIIDGVGDATIRPNIFIAAYLYPRLFTKREWAIALEHSLYALWNQWGGLSTIDKSDARFHEWHSGESPESYHNGDSWFWLNNLSAIAMSRVSQEHFKPLIDRIIKASCEEILFSGIIGHHAELSSSGDLRSEGSLSQAWSSAMFIELMHEIFHYLF